MIFCEVRDIRRAQCYQRRLRGACEIQLEHRTKINIKSVFTISVLKCCISSDRKVFELNSGVPFSFSNINKNLTFTSPHQKSPSPLPHNFSDSELF